MSVNLQLDQMTTGEKLRAMEDLWVDLTSNQDAYESPAWHETVLKAGHETFIDWDDAKRQLRDRMK